MGWRTVVNLGERWWLGNGDGSGGHELWMDNRYKLNVKTAGFVRCSVLRYVRQEPKMTPRF